MRVCHGRRKGSLPLALFTKETAMAEQSLERTLDYKSLKFKFINSEGKVIKDGEIKLGHQGLKSINGPHFNNFVICELKRNRRFEYKSEVNNYTILYELE